MTCGFSGRSGCSNCQIMELATRLFRTTSPALVARQAQCVDLPTSRPNTAVQVSASGIMVVSFQSSVDRNAASCDTHITWPWLSSDGGSGSFLSVVGNSGARVGNTPRALYGAGAKGRPRAPDRQSSRTWFNRNPIPTVWEPTDQISWFLL